MDSKFKFISTKLKIPAPRKNYIERTELFEELKGLEEYGLILVKGVAGSGKTTLLASFIREYASVKFKWLSLDSENNNVFSFWYYFTEAVSDYLGDAKNDVTALFDAVFQKEDIDLFLVCIDEDKQLYRYHNVFGEFLKLRFSTLDEQEKSNLLEKASDIFREIGDLEESAKLRLYNKNYKGMLETLNLLEPNYKAWSHLSRVPMAYLKENLDFIVQLFYYYYYNSDYKGIELMVEACSKEMEDQKTWRFLKIIKSMLVDFELCTELMTVDEIEQIRVSDTTKAILYLKTAAFLYMKFELNTALDFIEKAAIYDHGKNPFITLSVLSLRCGVKEELGDLKECERLYGDIFTRLESFKLLSDYKTNYYVGLTGIYIKTYQIEKARQCIGYAAKLYKEDNLYMDAAYLYNLIEIRLLQGNLEDMRQMLEKLLHVDAYKNILFMSGVIKLLIYADCMTSEISRNYNKMYAECDPAFIRIEDTLAYAKIMLHDGNPSIALELTDEVLPAARNQKIKFKLVEALLFKISILHTLNQEMAEIKNLMREAIYYSYENNILSPFIYEGEYLLKYLTAVREERFNDLKNGEKIFMHQLEELLKKDKVDSTPLSERELEVLNEMATGATNKVIADNLCISVSTVKTHIINIYSKLNVGTRVEAVELARKIKLLT